MKKSNIMIAAGFGAVAAGAVAYMSFDDTVAEKAYPPASGSQINKDQPKSLSSFIGSLSSSSSLEAQVVGNVLAQQIANDARVQSCFANSGMPDVSNESNLVVAADRPDVKAAAKNFLNCMKATPTP